MLTCAAPIERDRLGLRTREVAVAITGGGLREVFETILPEDVLMSAVRAAGLQERERKLNARVLLRSMIISASTGCGGRQADAMKIYFESGAKCQGSPSLIAPGSAKVIARSASSAWASSSASA